MQNCGLMNENKIKEKSNYYQVNNCKSKAEIEKQHNSQDDDPKKNNGQQRYQHRLNSNNEKDPRSKTPNEVKSKSPLLRKQVVEVQINIKRNASSAKPKLDDLQLRPNQRINNLNSHHSIPLSNIRVYDAPPPIIKNQDHKDIAVKQNAIHNLNKQYYPISRPAIAKPRKIQLATELYRNPNSEKKLISMDPKYIGNLTNPNKRKDKQDVKLKSQLFTSRPSTSKLTSNAICSNLISKGDLQSNHRPASSKQPNQSRLKQHSEEEHKEKKPLRTVSSKSRIHESSKYKYL